MKKVIDNFWHGGDIYTAAKELNCTIHEIIDLSSNISPFTPKLISNRYTLRYHIKHLPEPYCQTLKIALSKKQNIDDERIILSSGTTELIASICKIHQNMKALIPAPTYADYEKYCSINNISIDDAYLDIDNSFYPDIEKLDKMVENVELAFLCNPNNPTGVLINKLELASLVKKHKNALFVIDESYLPFVKDEKKYTFVGSDFDNVIVLRSFSKIYGVPGLRLGWGYCKNEDIIKKLQKHISLWSINLIAQEIGAKLIDYNYNVDIYKMNKIKNRVLTSLKKIKWLKLFDSSANFLLIKSELFNADTLYHYFLRQRILIRKCDNFRGLKGSYIRISIKTKKEMELLIKHFLHLDRDKTGRANMNEQ